MPETTDQAPKPEREQEPTGNEDFEVVAHSDDEELAACVINRSNDL
ncbi:hypothetical protein ACH4M4_34495 [Streptomyces sp. NPDC017254]